MVKLNGRTTAHAADLAPFARAAVWLRRSWRRDPSGFDCRPARDPRDLRTHPQVEEAEEGAGLRQRGAAAQAGEEAEDRDRPSTEEAEPHWEELRTAPRGDPETGNLRRKRQKHCFYSALHSTAATQKSLQL